MNSELLQAAKTTARLINTRLRVVIPSILAADETFTARFSVTGGDALPAAPSDLLIRFEGSGGIAGLPATFRLPTGASTGCIEGLTATGAAVAWIHMQVELAGRAVITHIHVQRSYVCIPVLPRRFRQQSRALFILFNAHGGALQAFV